MTYVEMGNHTPTATSARPPPPRAAAVESVMAREMSHPPPTPRRSVWSGVSSSLCAEMTAQGAAAGRAAAEHRHPMATVPTKQPAYVMSSMRAASRRVAFLDRTAAPARARFPVKALAPVTATRMIERGYPIAPNTKRDAPVPAPHSGAARSPPTPAHSVPPHLGGG